MNIANAIAMIIGYACFICSVFLFIIAWRLNWLRNRDNKSRDFFMGKISKNKIKKNGNNKNKKSTRYGY